MKATEGKVAECKNGCSEDEYLDKYNYVVSV
jgi:hypothetical protein